MTKAPRLQAAYDAGSDVLYISMRKTLAVRGMEDKFGFVWRYDGVDNLIGVTVIDYSAFWLSRRSVLESQLAQRFSISKVHAHELLDSFEHGAVT